jgi:hypothetical protein
LSTVQQHIIANDRLRCAMLGGFGCLYGLHIATVCISPSVLTRYQQFGRVRAIN